MTAISAAIGFNLALTAVSSSGSLKLSGSGAYAEAPPATDLNITGDWTVETWFKDEDSNGFDHDFRTLINKGDREASPSTNYVISVAYKRLYVGKRNNWTDQVIGYDLWANGVDPTKWHHVAASYRASTRLLTLYLDGVQVARGQLPAGSGTNSFPVEMGRNGAVSGKYWNGKIDDVRIWNVVRASSDVALAYRAELTSPQPGLVANWKFNDGNGSSAADSAGGHVASLNGGASFSTDVHAELSAVAASRIVPATPTNTPVGTVGSSTVTATATPTATQTPTRTTVPIPTVTTPMG